MDFSPSQLALDTAARVRAFIDENVHPIEERLLLELRQREDPWVVLPEVTALKHKARE